MVVEGMMPHVSCKKADFDIDKIERRVYGAGHNRKTLILANITNKVTGVKFEDWVRPDQLKTRDGLCSLIDWKYGKNNNVAGTFSCKKATVTVTRNDDDTFNIDGVKYEDGYMMEFNSVTSDFVNDIKKKFEC